MKRIAKKVSLLFLLSLLVGKYCNAQKEYQFPFLNPALGNEVRVNDLVGRMTLDEKIGQMMNAAPAIERLNKSPIEELIITNSIPLKGRSSPKITVLSVATLLAEAIKTLMETGFENYDKATQKFPKKEDTLYLIYQAVSTDYAKKLWDNVSSVKCRK